MMFNTESQAMVSLRDKLPRYSEYKREDGWPEPDEWRLRRV